MSTLKVIVGVGLMVALGESQPLQLTKIDQTVSPNAKCIDGTAPAYYWRNGNGTDSKKAVLFLEGGGWCYPSEVLQVTGANCAYRAKSGLGSSTGYKPSIPNTGYEGGSGYLSGNSTETAWANWSVAYVKYCDGGSMTGTRMEPTPARNGSGPLYYRGHYNIVAQLDNMVATKALDGYEEIVLSGCSAGGMACYAKCDFVAGYFAKHSIPVKCICDAGMFLDVETVTNSGNIMEDRYHDIADVMESKPGLSPICTAAESDWRQCLFSEHSLKYMKTPTFVINSLYNFGAWALLAQTTPGVFPVDGGPVPPEWADCWPATGKLTPTTYAKCNATQKTIIQHFREQFMAAAAPAIDPSTPHGIFADSCPNQHCQTSTGWNVVTVDGTLMRDAAARWYFDHTVEKHVDDPFMSPLNPTCGFSNVSDNVKPMCNNCANEGLGSNCLWNSETKTFHGLDEI